MCFWYSFPALCGKKEYEELFQIYGKQCRQVVESGTGLCNSGLWLIGTGTVVLIAAVFDWNPFGPLFGYPITGRGIRAKYGSRDDIPGEA